MDGNGRWAAARGLPVAEGHREGARALRRTVEAAIDLGVESLAVYAFSTENWARPPDEVESIMELMDETIDRELPDLAKQGVRTRFFGRRDRVPAELQEKMARLEAETAHLDRLQLWIAFDYGGRAELVEATARAARARHQPPRTCPKRTSSRAALRARAARSRPRDPHLRRAAASRTSCSGSPRTRSSSSTTRSGPTSARSSFAPRSRSTRAAGGGSARDERDEPARLARPRRRDPPAARHRPRLPRRLVALRARARRRPPRAARAVRDGARAAAARPRRLPRIRPRRCSGCSSAASSGCSAGCSPRSSSPSSSSGSAGVAAVGDDVVRRDAARRRLGGSGHRLPAPHPRHPRVRLLGGHGGALHGLRGRHRRVLRRPHARPAPAGAGDLARRSPGRASSAACSPRSAMAFVILYRDRDEFLTIPESLVARRS